MWIGVGGVGVGIAFETRGFEEAGLLCLGGEIGTLRIPPIDLFMDIYLYTHIFVLQYCPYLLRV